MTFKKYYILGFLVFASQFLFAQIAFKTAVSKNKLGVNQRFRVQFTVNKQGADNFQPPSFANFRVVGGPSSSVNQSWVNGKSSFSQSFGKLYEFPTLPQTLLLLFYIISFESFGGTESNMFLNFNSMKRKKKKKT